MKNIQSSSPCTNCEKGKDGYCEEASFIVTPSGIEACLTYRLMRKPLAVGNEGGGQEK